MKIIGKTEHGYLIEATGHEFALAGGYRFDSEMPGVKRGDYGRVSFPIGYEADVAATHGYLNELRKREDDVAASASVLEGLARMLRAALPTTMIPPAPEEKPAEEAAK